MIIRVLRGEAIPRGRRCLVSRRPRDGNLPLLTVTNQCYAAQARSVRCISVAVSRHAEPQKHCHTCNGHNRITESVTRSRCTLRCPSQAHTGDCTCRFLHTASIWPTHQRARDAQGLALTTHASRSDPVNTAHWLVLDLMSRFRIANGIDLVARRPPATLLTCSAMLLKVQCRTPSKDACYVAAHDCMDSSDSHCCVSRLDHSIGTCHRPCASQITPALA